MTNISHQKRLARARRTHALARKSKRPRLVVYRSNRALYAQIVDDAKGVVVCGTSSLKEGCNLKAATAVGKAIAEKAQAQNITQVAFDRNGYLYHGKIKALADGARAGGLDF